MNQQDHGAAAKTLRDALGNRFPKAQESRLSRILGQKDEVQYGTRPRSRADAEQLLEQLEDFARWAETEMARAR